jgi:hypothetical protein
MTDIWILVGVIVYLIMGGATYKVFKNKRLDMDACVLFAFIWPISIPIAIGGLIGNLIK